MTPLDLLTRHRRWNRKYWIAAIVLFVGITVLEWRTDFVEKALGHYLVWQNAGREKVGRRWQVEKKQVLAGTRLEKLSQELRSREKQLAAISSFDQLLDLVAQEKQVVLPDHHFVRLYETLPWYLKTLLLPPDSLVALQLVGGLENVLFNQAREQVEVLVLAGESRVSHYSLLSDAQVEILRNHGQLVPMNIAADPRYQGRLFAFPAFWKMLSSAQEGQVQEQFLEALPALLEHARPTTKIGISNSMVDQFVEIAVAPDNVRAYLYYVPDSWIIDFVNQLERDRRQVHENANHL